MFCCPRRTRGFTTVARKQVCLLFVASPEHAPHRQHTLNVPPVLYPCLLLCSNEVDTCGDTTGTDNRVTPSEEAAQRPTQNTSSTGNQTGMVSCVFVLHLCRKCSAIVSANKRVSPYIAFKFELVRQGLSSSRITLPTAAMRQFNLQVRGFERRSSGLQVLVDRACTTTALHICILCHPCNQTPPHRSLSGPYLADQPATKRQRTAREARPPSASAQRNPETDADRPAASQAPSAAASPPPSNQDEAAPSDPAAAAAVAESLPNDTRETDATVLCAPFCTPPRPLPRPPCTRLH